MSLPFYGWVSPAGGTVCLFTGVYPRPMRTQSLSSLHLACPAPPPGFLYHLPPLNGQLDLTDSFSYVGSPPPLAIFPFVEYVFSPRRTNFHFRRRNLFMIQTFRSIPDHENFVTQQSFSARHQASECVFFPLPLLGFPLSP